MKEPQYIKVDEDGNKHFYKDKELTIKHRSDGPAIEWGIGGESWYVNGKRHREDGPAVTYSSGGVEWWVDDKLHRVDGPAIEAANGDKEWWFNDKLHRADGPAIEYSNGFKGWMLHGVSFTEEHFKTTIQPSFITINGVTRNIKRAQYSATDKYGNKYYYKDKKMTRLHRDDGPAVEYSNGDKSWYINGIKLTESEFKYKGYLFD